MITDKEKEVLKNIGAAHRAFAELDQTHPSDLPDFVNGVHIMQGMIMQRICRRENPEVFPTYETRVVKRRI